MDGAFVFHAHVLADGRGRYSESRVATGQTGQLSTPPPFSIELTRLSAQRARLRVSGELDLSTSPRLSELLGQELESGKSVLLDLSEVSFIDSTALNTLVTALRSCESNGGSFELAADLPGQVRRVFQVTGLDAVLPIASA